MNPFGSPETLHYHSQEWLKKSDDMALQEFRKECRDRARQLEQLVISDVSRGATDLDPSALLAEARRSYLASSV